MIKMNFPSSRIVQKVARTERRHKLERKCPYSSETITRHSVFRKRPPTTRFAARFASWHGNIIPTLPRTKRSLRKSLRKSTKRMRCWAIPRSARNTINSAGIGIVRAGSSHHLTGNGKDSDPAADFISGVAMAAEFNSSSTEPDSATSSKHFSAVAAAVRLSVDLADVRRRRNVAPMSKPISWSRLKKHCTVRPEQSRCAGLAQIKWKITRLRSRAASTKDSESACAVRAKRAHAEEKAAISFFACVWRDTRILQSKAVS